MLLDFSFVKIHCNKSNNKNDIMTSYKIVEFSTEWC
jgi:hypothetical protein